MKETTTYFLLIIFLLLGIGIGIFVERNYFNNEDININSVNSESVIEWNTHVEDYYGYSIKYPSSWYFKEDEPKIMNIQLSDKLTPVWSSYFYSGSPENLRKPTMLQNGEVSIGITTYKIIQDIALSEVSIEIGPSSGQTPEETKINGINALKYIEDRTQASADSAKMYSEITYVKKNNQIYKIDVTAYNKSNLEAERETINKMLDSFTFLD